MAFSICHYIRHMTMIEDIKNGFEQYMDSLDDRTFTKLYKIVSIVYDCSLHDVADFYENCTLSELLDFIKLIDKIISVIDCPMV